MTRIFIALLCLVCLALIACDKKAENRSAPPQNQAGQAAEHDAAPTAAAHRADDAAADDDTTANDETANIGNGADDDTADDDGAFAHDDGEGTATAADDNAVVAPGGRDPAWAVPIAAEGLPNLHRVNGQLYRGAQPTAEGFRQLEKMGIKTVVNLRSFHSDRKRLRGTGLAYESIDMKAWHAENEDIIEFLKIVTDPARQPVFVHCQHGADRTGTVCAVYRIVVQGWDKEDAIREMQDGGFGFHKIWRGLPKYIRKLDVAAIRKKIGLVEEAATSNK